MISEELRQKLGIVFPCGDGYCDIAGKKSGQHTNSRCHCLDFTQNTTVRMSLRRAFQILREEIERLQNNRTHEFRE
jgi:hypothetical protein